MRKLLLVGALLLLPTLVGAGEFEDWAQKNPQGAKIAAMSTTDFITWSKKNPKQADKAQALAAKHPDLAAKHVKWYKPVHTL